MCTAFNTVNSKEKIKLPQKSEQTHEKKELSILNLPHHMTKNSPKKIVFYF